MQEAIVLIGPTGSGKTPLGELLTARGFRGRRCIHFDFGAVLRRIASGDAPAGDFDDDEIEFIRGVLETGALLEDRDFHIALQAIRAELTAQGAEADCIVALNGLPRHAGQARDLRAVVDVRTVVLLNCSPEVVAGRIATNAGGDRTGRRDDHIDAVTRRLEIFATRTAPLADYYRHAGAAVETIEVTETTTPQGIADELDRRRPPATTRDR
ncbi:MAG: nucleoside monophosphate kinase [Phycisphaerae bacterium]|jgi:adenylate kinase family enzyme|nr:nucleoside monophosphate kinase [Phycisphaerae bacterium]